MTTPRHQTEDRSGNSRAKLVLPIVLDVVAPVVLYYVFKAVGMSDVLALTIAGLVPAIRIIYTVITERRLNNLAALVLLMVVAAIGLAFVTGDAKWVLAKESFFTAAAGIWCLVTLLGRKPIMYYAARPFATRGRAAREALWEPTWERSEPFRAIVRRITLAWGAMFLLDAIARLIVINAAPVEKAVFQSQLPGIVLLVATIVFTRMSGGRLRKILDAQAAEQPGR
jgi:intracellular septation protein A